MPENQTTPEQEAYERGFRAGWDARGNTPTMALPTSVSMRCTICGLVTAQDYVCMRLNCPTMPRMLGDIHRD